MPQCLKITEKVSFNIASEASYLGLHFEWTRVDKKWEKSSIFASFRKPEAMLAVKQCYQIGQLKKDKSWWKMPKFNCDILSNFQTMC